MNNFIPAWYVLYTKPNQEKKVAYQLQEKEIRFLLPTFKTLREWHDRKKIIEKPLFPSYIFVLITSINDYYNCMDSEGFCYYVKFGNQLATVTQETINNIEIIMSKGNNLEVAASNFQRGQKLVIKEGPLCGIACEVVDINGKEKVCVHIHLLNRTILADMHSSMLTAEQITQVSY
jgi:transcriptional antiterminator RfaH